MVSKTTTSTIFALDSWRILFSHTLHHGNHQTARAICNRIDIELMKFMRKWVYFRSNHTNNTLDVISSLPQTCQYNKRMWSGMRSLNSKVISLLRSTLLHFYSVCCCSSNDLHTLIRFHRHSLSWWIVISIDSNRHTLAQPHHIRWLTRRISIPIDTMYYSMMPLLNLINKSYRTIRFTWQLQTEKLWKLSWVDG